MALAIGKLTILVGAGLVGSVIAAEGRLPGVSDLVSGAFKIAFKGLKQDNSTKSSPKPKYDSLLQQIDGLRQELDLVASNRPVTIVTGDRSGSGKYGVIVVALVAGYGYIWWKGWKISDMMFATKRGLNDACSSVSKQLETVYTSISVTKRHLSTRIDRVDCKINECADNTIATKEQVSELGGEVKLIGTDVKSVHHVVRSLETKINRIEGRQNETMFGVGQLIDFVQNLGEASVMEQLEASASRPAIEFQEVTPSRALSLPPITPPEPLSPSTSNGSLRKQASFGPSSSASGLKDIHEISEGVVGMSSLSTPQVSKGEETKSDGSNSGLLGRTFSLFSRSRSATQSFKPQ